MIPSDDKNDAGNAEFLSNDKTNPYAKLIKVMIPKWKKNKWQMNKKISNDNPSNDKIFK